MTSLQQRKPVSDFFRPQADSATTEAGGAVDQNGNHAVTSQRAATPTLSPGPHSHSVRPPLQTLPQQGILDAIQEEAEEKTAADTGMPHALTDTNGQHLRSSRPKAAKMLHFDMPDDQPGAAIEGQLLGATRPEDAG